MIDTQTLFIGQLITAVIALIPLIKMIRDKPEKREIQQPLQVTPSPVYVSKQDCEKFHCQQEAAVNNIIAKCISELKACFQEELRNMETEHTKRTDALRSELTGAVKGVHQRIDKIFDILRKDSHAE
jgi:hypothetical protein